MKTLTVAEFSRKYGLSQQAISVKIRSGEIPANRCGRRYQIDESAAERWARGWCGRTRGNVARWRAYRTFRDDRLSEIRA